MRKSTIRNSLLLFTALCGMQAFAVPAKPGLLTVKTADGSELRVRLAGDEFFHQYFTEDGYPVFEKDGFFYYGDVKSDGSVSMSDIKAVNVAQRGADAKNYVKDIDMRGLESRIRKRASLADRRASIVGTPANRPARAASANADGNDGPPYERGYGLFPDERFPAYGSQKAIVVLVEFQDLKFNASYDAHDYFSRMLNEDNFADYGATGCAAQFFRENSNGAFTPEFDVFGPITLSNNMSYYGGNDWWGNDLHPADMVKEACEQLDATVDFSEYDRDNDGIVDNIFVFYAGRGEASGGAANTVWPHSWNMVSAGYENLYFDGVRIHTYGCSNEWEGSRPDGVGTFVHEFSHVMGLPDLYATDYTTAFTPGAYSALDYGPYNNDGMTPPNYGAFERYALGWMKPNEIKGPLSATLRPVTSNMAGIIHTSKDTEFFLLENRQKTGWDAYIPGHGMLIWHVDYDASVWTRNTVNNSASHQYVDIEEADGTQSEYSQDGDTFPGTGNKTSFTATTTPAMKTWNNESLDYPITDIAENDGIITFNVLGGAVVEMPEPKVSESQPVSPTSVRLTWEPMVGYETILNVYSRSEASTDGRRSAEGEVVFVPGFRDRNMGSASEVVIDGLEENSLYHYTFAYTNGWYTSEPSAEMDAVTPEVTLQYMKVNALGATDIDGDRFTANWETIDDADDYVINVYEIQPIGTNEDVCAFDNGVEDLGDWSTTSTLTYGMTSYSGEAAPSLRLSDGKTLTSPVYEDYINGLSFWQRGNNSSPDDVVNIYAIVDGSRVFVASEPVNKDLGGVTVEIEEFPSNAVQVILEYKRAGDTGFLALDDVKVSHGVVSEPVLLEEYTELHTGNVAGFTVTGLKPLTEYEYCVKATDGTLTSLESDLVRVRTNEDSGVNNVDGDHAFTVKVSGLTLISATSDEMVVADYTGSTVARGFGKVTLPRAGLYIVSVPARGYVVKVAAR